MSTSEPLKFERRSASFLSFAFAVVGFCVGLIALVRANQEQRYINGLAAVYGPIDVGIHDAFATGILITIVCALLAILSGVFCAFTWYPIEHKPFSFRIQSLMLFFCAAWLFVALVTYDFLFANRLAQIAIHIHGLPDPDPVTQRLEKLLDLTHTYRDVFILRLLAVLPWFAFILAMATGVVLHLAAGRVKAVTSNTGHGKRDRVGPRTQPPPC